MTTAATPTAPPATTTAAATTATPAAAMYTITTSSFSSSISLFNNTVRFHSLFSKRMEQPSRKSLFKHNKKAH